jgi:2'-5' RNA ligase
MKALYFIAILPPKEVAESIHEVRLDFALKYKSEEALKPPVHLTLKEPFTMDVKEELILKRKLNFIATQNQPFLQKLKGFGRYQKHAIYIKSDEDNYLTELKKGIQKLFKSVFYYVQQDQMPFSPHYSIAYRDVGSRAFDQAFAYYENQVFLAQFNCTQFCLLKYDGKKWHNIQTYGLSGAPNMTLFDMVGKLVY